MTLVNDEEVVRKAWVMHEMAPRSMYVQQLDMFLSGSGACAHLPRQARSSQAVAEPAVTSDARTALLRQWCSTTSVDSPLNGIRSVRHASD